jgi:hypothetical protein
MCACLASFAHAANMHHDYATDLTVSDWRAGLIHHFYQNVSLGNVIVAGDLGTGNGKDRELRRAVEIGNDLHALPANPVPDPRAERFARSDPPPHAVVRQKRRIVVQHIGQPDALAAHGLRRNDRRIEVEHPVCATVGKNSSGCWLRS